MTDLSLPKFIAAVPAAARIWDAPVRLFHWLFALAFAGAWMTTGDRFLHVHAFAGYVFGGLLVFRLVWGFAGTTHARFASFACGPRAAVAYLRDSLRRRARRFIGHNPAGSWAVWLMLACSGALVLSGLAALGGQEQAGPLAGWLGFAAGSSARVAHELAAWSLVALVTVHVLGVVGESLVHRENLPLAMLTGRKRAGHGADAPARAGVAAAMLAAVAAGALTYFAEAMTLPAGEPYRPYKGPTLADDALWRDECGSCHLAYHPSLLPARSWRDMMAAQDDHFGEDLALYPETVAAIEAFLVRNAADGAATEAAWNIMASTGPAEAPLRVTDTRYWRHKHSALDGLIQASPRVHGNGDCAGCHLDARAGTFRDGAMRLPPASGAPFPRHTLAAQETKS